MQTDSDVVPRSTDWGTALFKETRMTGKRRLLRLMQLLRDPLPVRELAKTLGVSVRQIQRDMRLLREFDLVDYDCVGKGCPRYWFRK